MSQQDFRDNFQGDAKSARKGRGMSAKAMRRQGNPDLRGCTSDERRGFGVAEAEDPLLRLPPLPD